MTGEGTPSVEISIALLSWINEQLREEIAVEPDRSFWQIASWIPRTMTLLAYGLCGAGLTAIFP